MKGGILGLPELLCIPQTRRFGEKKKKKKKEKDFPSEISSSTYKTKLILI